VGVTTWLGLGALGVAGVLVAGWVWRKWHEPPDAPPSRWQGGDAVTPNLRGPADSIRERVARGPALTQAVLLAVEMARADGHVADEETEAIRQFILRNVTGADDAFADRVLRGGLGTSPGHDAVQDAIETIRAISSEEQLRLVLQLLVHVAQADGTVRPTEAAFMQQVGTRLGLGDGEVDEMLMLR